MTNPSTAYQGRGSKLAVSIDGITYSNVAQLKKVAHDGSTLTMLDSTSIGAAAKTKIPSKAVDSGDMSMEGVLNPTHSSQVLMRQLHAAGTLAFFELLLTDGTMLMFQAYISKFAAAVVEYSKALTFSATLSISGGITYVLGVSGTGMGNPAFQPDAFQNDAFQVM